MTVLRRGGLGACTAPAIADASPLTKSALHYYFADTDEIVDVAFRRLMEQFLERVQDAAAAAPDPLSTLWAATETYLRLGSGPPGPGADVLVRDADHGGPRAPGGDGQPS